MDPATIACTLYNMLALGACSLDEARLRALRLGHQHSMGDLRQAAQDLIILGRIEKVSDDLFKVRGPEGMVVHKRDRDDAWNGWELKALDPAKVRAIVSPPPPVMLDEFVGGRA